MEKLKSGHENGWTFMKNNGKQWTFMDPLILSSLVFRLVIPNPNPTMQS
jgi:hypothetical protein